MFPKLFKIPFINQPVYTYGLMLVIAFLAAIYLIRRLSKDITPKPQMITNAALYALVAGIAGARLFYVFHYWDDFRDNFFSILAIWDGGLEQLGGALTAILVIFLYIRFHKLPARKFFDIIAIALVLALAIGRIGCFASGCCFGKPSKLPWAVRFPYASNSFNSQILPNHNRNRPQPYLNLPSDFYDASRLKPYSELTDRQKKSVAPGFLFCFSGSATQSLNLFVHPTQLYSSSAAGLLSLTLFLLWRRNKKIPAAKKGRKFLSADGTVFALMFIFYSVGRFLMEFLRDDNPYEYGWWAVYKGGTISQNISIYIFIAGLVLLFIFQRIAAKKSNT